MEIPMHILQLSRRNGEAQERLLKAAGKLAEGFGIKPEFVKALEVQQKDPAIRAMQEREAIANLLEELVKVSSQPPAILPVVLREAKGSGEPMIAVEGDTLVAPEPVKKPRRKKKGDIPPPVIDESLG